MKGMFLWVSAIHSLRCEPLIRTCSPLLISSLSQSTCYDVGKVGGWVGRKRLIQLIGIQWVKLKLSTDPLEFTQKSSLLVIFQLCYEDRSSTLSPDRYLTLSTIPLLLHHTITIRSVPRQPPLLLDLCDPGAGASLLGRGQKQAVW